MKLERIALCMTLLLPAVNATGASAPEQGPTLPSPILFVTQVPIPRDFATVNATFGNHLAGISEAGRGGDLWIRYEDGTLRNLTAAAGLGVDGFQNRNAIAVRDPAVHWDGNKAVFAMAIGAPEAQYRVETYRWQLYEIAGLGVGDTPLVTRVANQPAAYNNVMPTYLSDDRILFVSDRPRGGLTHLYPQLDEYERTPTNTGLWSLDPATGDIQMLDHAPSGDFEPIVDSFGRVVFTRWDHLERDQLADADAGPVSNCFHGNTYGSFDYSDESAAATIDLNQHRDVFPEPRSCRNDLLAGTNLQGHGFNHFLPWMVNQDGTDLETLNHIGRHELHGYLARTFTNDPNIIEYYGQYARTNPNTLLSFHHPSESAVTPGRYLGIDAPEFGTHAAGQVVSINGSPSLNPDDMVVTYVTHRSTASTSDSPGPEHSGLYRDPIEITGGTTVVSHTTETRADQNAGSTSAPLSRYHFRLRVLASGGAGGTLTAGAYLTPGINETITWWSPDVLTSYSGELWELNPVEVRPRPRPAAPVAQLDAPEQQVFTQVGVLPADLINYMRANELALIVSRNVTTRDDADRQQPLNLAVPGGTVTIPRNGTVYDVRHLQIYQADHLRGQANNGVPRPGRRVLARTLHDLGAVTANRPTTSGPPGSVEVASDGSVAAFVPARRALTWQLTDSQQKGVVRERFWLTFQPGEVRVCASCHGVNRTDQLANPPPQNPPQALVQLLQYWQASQGSSWRNLYRLYHSVTNEHLFTTDVNEYVVLGGRDWAPEGVAYRVLLNDQPYQGIPAQAFYRLYHAGIRQHLWTTDGNEYSALPAHGWAQEGIIGYLLTAAIPGQTVPLFRLAHRDLPLHHWTTDLNEYNTLATRGWVQEGVIGHVQPALRTVDEGSPIVVAEVN